MAGATIDEMKRIVEGMIPRLHIYVVLDTLEYVRRGGRIGRARAFLGTIMRVKPVLSFKEGEVHPEERVRTRAHALDRMFQLATSYPTTEAIGVAYSTNAEEADAFKKRVEEALDGTKVQMARLGPVIGVHGDRERWASVCWREITKSLASPLEGLRKVLALERAKKYNDAAVVGGMDSSAEVCAGERRRDEPPHFACAAVPAAGWLSGAASNTESAGRRAIDYCSRDGAECRGQESGATCRGATSRKDHAVPAEEGCACAGEEGGATQSEGQRSRCRQDAEAARSYECDRDTGCVDLALGVKPADAAKFAKKGVRTVRDLLFLFPNWYHDYSELRPISELKFGEEQTVVGTVFSAGR